MHRITLDPAPVHTTYYSLREQPVFAAFMVSPCSSVDHYPGAKLDVKAIMPFALSVGLEPDEYNTSLWSPVHEIGPYEFGVSHLTLAGSAAKPIECLGNNFDKAVIPSKTNFDNSG